MDSTDRQNDSDQEYEKPKDEFLFYHKAFKLEEKKFTHHQAFEEITAKYWQLLRADPECDISQPTLSKAIYIKLLSRVYKVLLPLFRKEEMKNELDEMWGLDSRGQPALTFQLLTKVLFRIAHEWAINVDLEEYIDLLTRIYARITSKVACLSGYQQPQTQQITVSFPADEQYVAENGGQLDKGAQGEEWLDCRDDESNKSDYEYKYEEDPAKMTVKRFKKHKNKIDALGASSANQTIREPFIYVEEVTYPWLASSCTTTDLLSDINQIVPFGFVAEQFFAYLKTDIEGILQAQRDINKTEIARLKREMREQNTTVDLTKYQTEEDTGLQADATCDLVERNFNHNFQDITSTSANLIANVSTQLCNNIRKILRDAQYLTLRMECKYPTPQARSKPRSQLMPGEPITEVNQRGFNPALDRRICYRPAPLSLNIGTPTIYNIYYLLESPRMSVLYRADVQRVETKDKLSIKEAAEDGKKEEEFVNVETSFKKTRQIQLQMKFAHLYQDHCSVDNKEQKRLQRTVDKEQKRKEEIMKQGNSLVQKALSETYEDKNLIRMMKGPFYQLDSKTGAKEDYLSYSMQDDLIASANQEHLRILVIGKPRAGKSTLCKNLAQKLDLIHINVDNWMNALLLKIKTQEEEGQPELEEGEVAPKFLSDLEESVIEFIKVGDIITEDQIVQILTQQIQSPAAKTKGYVLDLYFNQQQSQTWTNLIRDNGMLGSSFITYENYQFTHVIEILMDDEEIKQRAENMRLNPVDNIVYSRWEREERKKPKVLAEGEDEPDPDDENAIKPFDENALTQRISDTQDQISYELDYYNNNERPSFDEMIMNFYDSQYIKIDSAGLTPEQLTNSVVCKIRLDQDIPLRPLAVQIEGGNDYKSLLTEGQEENQIPRIWSSWKQIDPVAIYSGILVQGLPEFAASYYNSVFVFSTEQNMKDFIQQPKVYLTNAPRMPSTYRILILGPAGSGRHTLAENLRYRYGGLRVVDYKSLVLSYIEELKSREIHIANNPMFGGCIGLSESELAEIIEGKPFAAHKFIPWMLNYLGFELEKKRPPPPEEKKDDDVVEEELDEEEKKKRKDAEIKKKKEEDEKRKARDEEIAKLKEERRKKRIEAMEQGLDLAELGLENEDEEPVIIDDLSIDDLVLKGDEEGKNKPFVGGFILVGFPETEEQMRRLKEHGIEFDRVIYLQDTNEDDPGKEIKERMTNVESYDYDWEVENSTKILAMVREAVGDDIVKEISCNGQPNDVLIRVVTEIDPFAVKVDNPDDVRVTADLGEEDKRLPKGDFGDYCPITLSTENWLVRGNPEFELTVQGRSYWFAGEAELEKFKFNPDQYLGYGPCTRTIPNPKVMVLGHKGAGVTTQIRCLCEKYKLQEFNLKDAYLSKLKEEKDKRKRRRLLDRGFRPLQPPEEEGMEQPVDPEIEDDPEDFDKAAHERDVMKMVLSDAGGLVIDGTWTDIPDDTVGQSLQEILFESRRLPEMVIMLKCKEKSTFDRMIDYNAIKGEYNLLMDQRAELRRKTKEEDRTKKIDEMLLLFAEIPEEDKTQQEKDEEMEQEMNKWDEDREIEDDAQDENDPDKPNLDDMTEKFREKLRERREKDDVFMEEFATAMIERNVIVINDIKSDISAEYVSLKLLDRVKLFFSQRQDLIEKFQAQILKPDEVPFYEKSYIYQQSKFGPNSPLQISNPAKSKKYAVLYRNRIYFPANAEEQDQFLQEPSKYVNGKDSIPLDIQIKPKVFVLGISKSGKSTLCKKLESRLGLIHLHMTKIIQSFMDKDSIQCDQLRARMCGEGQPLEDEMMVNLLLKRLQFDDCCNKGWVLEDFPKTRNQAILLAKKGLVPTNVFYMRFTKEASMGRNEQERFGCLAQVKTARYAYIDQNMPNLLAFYQRYYNNVCDINTSLSIWYIEDKSIKDIQDVMQARQEFSKQYSTNQQRIGKPCKMQNLHMDKCLAKQSISDFKYYCPVSWKNERLIINCCENFENAVLFQSNFYFFKSQKETEMFIINPDRFLQSFNFPKLQDLPIRFYGHKAAEIVRQDKSLKGFCATTLMDEERVVKGDPLYLLSLKEAKYQFCNEFKLQRFLQNPFKYSKAVLPVKMPPTNDKVSLYNLSKMDDSITFMEQALGSIVTRALREVSENRLKYPTISLKETMLKLFALFLKTNNPSNTEYMKQKYQTNMKQFIERCELPEEIFDLANEKGKKNDNGQWPEFKENYYNKVGDKYDEAITQIQTEKTENFINYIR